VIRVAFLAVLFAVAVVAGALVWFRRGGGFDQASAQRDFDARVSRFDAARFDVDYQILMDDRGTHTNLSVRWQRERSGRERLEFSGVFADSPLPAPITLVTSDGASSQCSADASLLGAATSGAGGACTEIGGEDHIGGTMLYLFLITPWPFPVSASVPPRELAAVVESVSSRTIAGQSAKCFEIQLKGENEACLREDGVPLAATTGLIDGGTLSMKAVQVRPTPGPLDLTLPYPTVEP
jgi:hypothetical protein